MLDLDLLAGDVRHHVNQAIDGHHLFRPDVHRTEKVLRHHQATRRLETLVDVQEGSRLLAVPPNLDRVPRRRFRHLAAHRGRCLLATPHPGPFGAEDVVVARNRNRNAVVAVVRQVQVLREELLPAVLAVRICRISGIFPAVRIVRIGLVVLRVHARRTAVEDLGLVHPEGLVQPKLDLEDV